MNFVPEAIEQYAVDHSPMTDKVLAQLERETYAKVLMPQMLSGSLQGQLLRMLSMLKKPTCILEIGTFTGYSAICLSAGLPPNGKLITIDNNEELKSMAQRYFQQAGLQSQIQLITGNALEVIPQLKMKFDLVFIDADKVNYPNYYNLALPLMNTGALLLADNVLWSGKILETMQDEDTRALSEFNNMVSADDRVENVLLPVRDGLMLAIKK